MDEPKLEKLIAEIKAKEAGGKDWLEKHLLWVVAAVCLVIGLVVGHLA